MHIWGAPLRIIIFFLEGDFVAQDAPNMRPTCAKMARRHQGEDPGGGLRRGYISLRSWTARHLARRSAERRRIRVWDSVRHTQAQGLARRIFSTATRVPATVLPRKSRLRGGLGTSLGGFGGLWAAFGWFLAPRGLLGVL